jgi:hypothetical protein
MHEIATDVKVHHVCLSLVIARLPATEILQSVDAIVCATSYDTGIGICYEITLIEFVGIVII